MEKEVKKILKNNLSYFKYLDESFKNEGFILELLRERIDITPYMNDEIKNKREIIKESLSITYKNSMYFEKIPWDIQKKLLIKNLSSYEYLYEKKKSFQQEKEVEKILERAILEKGSIVNPKTLPKSLTKNKKIALMYLKLSGMNLKYFPRFNKVKKIIKIAIEKDDESFNFIDEGLKRDNNFIKKLLKINLYVYQWIPEKTIDLSFFLIDQIGTNYFGWLSLEHKKNKDILYRYIEENELIEAEIDLKAYPELFETEKGVKLLMKRNGKYFSSLSENYKKNLEIVVLALNSGLSVHEITPELLENYKVAKAIVENFGEWLEYLPEKFKSNYNIAKAAILNNPMSIKYLSDRQKNNPKIIEIALNKNGDIIQYLNPEFIKANEDLILLIKNYPEILGGLDNKELKFWENILNEDCKLYKHFPNDIKKSRELSLKAVSNEHSNIRYAISEFRNDLEFLNIVAYDDDLLSEISFNLNLSNLVIKNPSILKRMVLNEPNNHLYLSTLDVENHKEILLEILEEIKIPVPILEPNFFRDKEILEKAIETQIIDYPIESYLMGNREYVLKAIKNNPSIIFDPYKNYVISDEKLLLEAIKINPEVIDNYTELKNLEISENCIEKLIEDYPTKTKVIFKKFNKYITKSLIFQSIHGNGILIDKGDKRADHNFEFLSYICDAFKSDFEILLRYIFAGGNNLEYFNFSLGEVINTLLIKNYSYFSYLKFMEMKCQITGESDHKKFYNIVGDIFDFPTIISLKLIEKKLKEKEIQVRSYFNYKINNKELLEVIKWIYNLEIKIKIPLHLMKIENEQHWIVFSPKELKIFINLIRVIILENHFEKIEEGHVLDILFPLTKEKSFKDIQGKILCDLFGNDDVFKKKVVSIIKKAFNIATTSSLIRGKKTEFYFSENYTHLIFRNEKYKVEEFFKKDGKIAIKTSKYSEKFLRSIEYLLKHKSLTRGDIKIIYNINSSAFNNLYNHRLKNRFMIFIENFRNIFGDKKYEININWEANKSSPLLKLKNFE